MILLQAASAVPQAGDLTSRLSDFYVQSLLSLKPELALVAGFLLLLLISIVGGKRTGTLSGILAILVFAVAGYFATRQWAPFVSGAEWKGGTLAFPYTQTLYPNYGLLISDNFALFFKILVSVAGIIASVMALLDRSLTKRFAEPRAEFFLLLIGVSIGLFLMPAATDILTMYIAIELSSIGSYVLAGYLKPSVRSSEASLKYLLYGAVSSGVLLYGFSLLYGLTGTTSLVAIGQILAVSQQAHHSVINLPMLYLSGAMILAGFAYKISAVPFHFWTPDAYDGAPMPVAAFLSVASKAAGIGMLMRFLFYAYPVGAGGDPIVDWPLAIAILSAASMTFGNLAALQQTGLKRMLAYSTIAHAGFILMGVAVSANEIGGLGTNKTAGADGIVAVVIYLAGYLFMNMGAFFAAMLVQNAVGSDQLTEYRGLGRRAPALALSMTIALVALTGIPATVGFIGKFYIFAAAATEPRWYWLIAVAAVNAVIAVYYYFKVISAMYLKREFAVAAIQEAGLRPIKEQRIAFGLGGTALVVLCIVPVIILGLYFSPLVTYASDVIRFFTIQ